MPYTVDDIGLVEAWTAASYDADDDTLDLDVTTCMTNGTEDEACDEWKEGTLNGRIVLNVDPAAITSFSIRFFLNSIMTGADSSILPYTDANSVSNTNENIQSYDTPEIGTWVEHVLSAAFIAELADLGGGTCAVRWASNDGAKSKLGEVNADIVLVVHTLDGISKDFAGDALGSVEFRIYKRTGLAPEIWADQPIKSGTTNSSTGVYSEELAIGTYRRVMNKDSTPQVMDVSPPLILSEVETDDVFSLGTFHNLINDIEVQIYQAGVEALPVGAVEDQIYFVVQQSGNTCELSLTQGGSSINITVAGVCWIVGKPELSV